MLHVLTCVFVCCAPLTARADLGGDLGRLYDMVARTFLASVSGDCVYEQTTAVLQCEGPDGEVFSATGRRMLVPGFTAIQPHAAFKDDNLPEFVRGDKVCRCATC